MAQIYYDALGRKGALAFVALLFIVQYFMGLSICVTASRQLWAFSRDGALPFSRFIRPIVSITLGEAASLQPRLPSLYRAHDVFS